MRLITRGLTGLCFAWSRPDRSQEFFTTMIDVTRAPGPKATPPRPQSHLLLRVSIIDGHQRFATSKVRCCAWITDQPPSWLAVKPKRADAITGGGARMMTQKTMDGEGEGQYVSKVQITVECNGAIRPLPGCPPAGILVVTARIQSVRINSWSSKLGFCRILLVPGRAAYQS